MEFNLIHTDRGSRARAGVLTTAHGDISTPVFMPVGTAGTVKAIHQRELEADLDARIILGNTYHLFMRPGMDCIARAGGLHRFMGWQRPILTDSGGYQVFSMAANRRLKEEGAWFNSHIDGSKHLFTPENIVDIQRTIGADIMMAFDECAPYPCDHSYALNSMELTHRWLVRGINRFSDTEPCYGYTQAFFPIVQGSLFADLRLRSAEFIAAQGAEGNAIGGLSVGEPADVMYGMLDIVTPILPSNKPRYLMGVGMPDNILEAIALGVDMFDCVIPTRNGRNGMLFTSEGIINIRNEKWKDDFTTLDPNGTIFVDQEYSKAYLRHLMVSGEMLGAQIATLHNLGFFIWLVGEARKQILSDNFFTWKNRIVKRLRFRL